MPKTELLIKERLKRAYILNTSNILHVTAGDIVVVAFWKAAIIYRFEGICIAVRKKSLSVLNTTLILRNVISGVGIEVTVSFFLNRVFTLAILDYKRKQFLYRKSKLYYVRQKLNRASRVK